MAAYAALVSILNTMEDITNHPRLSTSFDQKQIHSLREKADFLLDFVENHTSHGSSKEIRDLESQIASAACAAENVIESHVVDQIHDGFAQNSSISSLNLKKVIEEIDYVMEKVTKVKEEKGSKSVQLRHSISTPPTSSKPLISAKTTMVGFEEELIQLLDVLTGQGSSRHIISIVGMGGVGKTTLTRNAFEHPLIMEHFDIRGWVTISYNDDVRQILLELLSCQEIKQTLEPSDSEMDKRKSVDELGLKLYKSLLGRRYLIVLDDIWSLEYWDKLKFFFTDYDNGCRVVVTTRLSNIATQFCTTSFKINFLDKDTSWDLFCRVAFQEEVCPVELRKIGKEIVQKCKGLPLSIVVIGAFLGKLSRRKEDWERVLKDINSILKSDEDEFCLNLLSLSYTHLPAHLKPCFLYMGIVKEDQDINASGLVKLFVAEGFVKPNKVQTLEEISLLYLKDLVDRNLILVSKKRSNGATKSYRIHDLLREVCLREAEKEKFLHVMSMRDMPLDTEMERPRVVFHSYTLDERKLLDALPSKDLVRSIIKVGSPPSKFRLLKVLILVNGGPLEAVYKQVNLRYFCCRPSRFTSVVLPSSAALLWNLQTLIIKGTSERVAAPSEIWKMKQLRHLELNEVCLPDPPQQEECILPNLQTLANVVNFSFTDDVCKRIPNVEKLHVSYDSFLNNTLNNDLESLNKLQSLRCSVDEGAEMEDLWLCLTFPSSIKKLSLIGLCISWDNVTVVGTMLPNLEVLKLQSVVGAEWNVEEGAFPRLKFLLISKSELINWSTAVDSHFPVLEKLDLRGLPELVEIPLGIGDIPTFRYLSIQCCSVSAAISSTKILEEQMSLDNDEIEVRVIFKSREENLWFEAEVGVGKFPKKNFNSLLEYEWNYQLSL